MSDSGGRFPKTVDLVGQTKVEVADLASGLGGFGYDSQTSHRHNNLEACCRFQTQDEGILDERPTHQSCGRHCGIQAVHTRNNQEGR